jgi:hypothetical protein
VTDNDSQANAWIMHLKWPQYEVADDAAVYAIGVVSINYARFERTFAWMASAVANIPEIRAGIIMARVNAADRIRLIETFLAQNKWPADAEAATRHYLSAADVLVANRNVLIHSNIVRSGDNRSAIYSLTRKGTANHFQASVDEIRRVADDLQIYFGYGLTLANYIATEIHQLARQAGMLVVSQLPEAPPLPVHIDPRQRGRR